MVYSCMSKNLNTKCLDKQLRPISDFPACYSDKKRVQWLSSRVLDSRSRGCRFDPHRQHCIVSLSKTLILCLVLVQPKKTHPDMTEKNVDWDIKNQIKQKKLF